MDDQTFHADDEELLDDLFDEITTRILNGDPIDVAQLAGSHRHLTTRIHDMTRLAMEVVGQDTPTMSGAIPGYEIVRELGRGGMGTVFLAKQVSLGGRLVALKVLPQSAALSSQARTRFRSEAQALARLRHAHVIDIYDVVDSDITLAYAMEWIDGRSLLELSDHWVALGRPTESTPLASFLGGQLAQARMVHAVALWGQQVATALSAAHAQALLHRDVKPANVLIRRDGAAVLSDFGLVRDEDSSVVTRSGAFLGTPAYASPEQLRGAVLDERSDIYSLGATLYHALCGKPPFDRQAHNEVQRSVEDGPRQPLRKRASWIDRDIATIVETAMSVDLERRYASADDLAADLSRYSRGQPIHAQPAGAWLRMRKFARRNQHVLVGALAGSLLVLAVAVAVGAYLVRQSQIPAEFAEQVRTARLAMLDPGFDERVFAMMQNRSRPSAQQLLGGRAVHPKAQLADDKRAIAQHCLNAALALQHDVAIQAEHDVVALARLRHAPQSLDATAPATVALAARWPQAGEPPLVSATELAAMTRQDRRCLGLLAFLRGADSLCVTAWSGLDLAQQADPFVDAALGQLYLQRRQPQLAWPRLERAFKHFGQASFLAVAIAEVAHACGDSSYALRILQRVPKGERGPYATIDRVRADALLALGRRDEAREIYLRHAARGNVPPSSHVSLANFFLGEQEYRRALHHYWRVRLRWPGYPGSIDGLAEVLTRWWGSLGRPERHALLAEACAAPGGFADALCCVAKHADLERWPQLERLCRTFVCDPRQLALVRSWPRVRIQPYLSGVFDELPNPLVANHPEDTAPRRAGSQPRVVSVDADGAPANDDCHGVSVSANGRILAFASAAKNLVAYDGNGGLDVFWHDVATGRTRRASSRPDGAAAAGVSQAPALSGDGRYCAFYSSASDLVPNDDNQQVDCFICELATGHITCVSIDGAGKPQGLGETSSGPPGCSHDGRRVLFVQTSGQGRSQLVVYDLIDRQRLTTGPTANRPWQEVRLVRNGELVLATNSDAELRMPDTNHWSPDVFSFVAGEVEGQRVSEVHGRQADLGCDLAGSSADGQKVLLWTGASNLLTIDNPGARNLLLIDRAAQGASRINEVAGFGFEAFASASTNGSRTVFESFGPRNHRSSETQVWLRDGDAMLLVSHSPTGLPGTGASRQPQLSRDGRTCAFVTAAPNLLAGATTAGKTPAHAQVVLCRLPD